MTRLLSLIGLTGLLLAFIAPGSTAQEIEIEASKDNTLYESSTGSISNGSGSHLFAGSTNAGALRRALVMFDVASAVPDGAVAEDARLVMNMSKTVAGNVRIDIHRVLTDWGEGASNAADPEGAGAAAAENDATWLHTFFDTESWQNEGGDFAEVSSSSASVSGNGTYTWRATPTMLADIQTWIDTPDQNFGWIFIGGEANSRTAKRFDSRENANAANRPRLFVTVATGTASESESVPTESSLERAWPNPFGASTQLGFQLGRDSRVALEVFDVTGKRVAQLANGWMPAGRHEIKFEAGELPAGVYVSRLTTFGSNGEQTVATRTVILAR